MGGRERERRKKGPEGWGRLNQENSEITAFGVLFCFLIGMYVEH